VSTHEGKTPQLWKPAIGVEGRGGGNARNIGNLNMGGDRMRISRHAGHGFHSMPVQHFT
jgi:hypothetical protein